MGLTPALDKATMSETPIGRLYTTFPAARLSRGYGAGLCPLHSPLLRESSLVCFLSLTDMLKFSGQSRLVRGWLRYGFRLRETRGPSSPVVTPLRECTLAPRPPHI
ncbi:hypothetical protein DPMN_005300 [Dreissena polymorpha]|uniref:Uncharacterized protein n=1 Tax=Dreissena polymorpha TaxID=45954 RepID=A0A9D4MQ35_DREPO|nr:hypothetical protein DPMN_005300 [Dreissena polymorpha]